MGCASSRGHCSGLLTALLSSLSVICNAVADTTRQLCLALQQAAPVLCRYFGGSIGSIGKLSLVLLAASQAWSLVRKFDKGVKAGMKTRLEDPDVRAEMEQR